MSESPWIEPEPDDELTELFGGGAFEETERAANLATRARHRVERARSRRRAISLMAVAAALLVATTLLLLLPIDRAGPNGSGEISRMLASPGPSSVGGAERPTQEPTASEPETRSEPREIDTTAAAEVVARPQTAREEIRRLLADPRPGDRRRLRERLRTDTGAQALVAIAAESADVSALREWLVFTSRNAPVTSAADAIRTYAHHSPRAAAKEFWRGCERFRSDPSARRRFVTVGLRDAPAGLCEELGQDLQRSQRNASRSLGTIFAAAVADGRPKSGHAILSPLLDRPSSAKAALYAAGMLGDPALVPRLERFLLLADERAHAAAQALASMPGDEATRALLRAFRRLSTGVRDDPLSPTRDSITQALRLHGHRALEQLRREATSHLEAATVETLVIVFPEEAADELRLWLASASPRERPLVFRAFAELGDPASIDTLVEALDDPTLAKLARQSLTHIARRDHGSRPDAWRRWLSARIHKSLCT